ncbi:TlpA family protein disulfide reductase [Flammeovirga pectinis]|uniref:TlpA family protein disulfide reductase n=1 Tax=Flammeovirga pectinis TaxID=2494373 RepID=A0A3Q9FK29_9BACT|nr:TlpA disulfide reductase family protein [Flammeovirga pectinis]AZQ61471.1 TlpA family protein disulfide reductase [Flammeovirga pectinis]
MRNNLILFVLTIFVFSSCSDHTNQKTGESNALITKWRGVIKNDHQKEVPFYFTIQGEGKEQIWTLINGEERMEMDQPYYEGDSLHVPLLIYEAELVVKENDTTVTGEFVRNGAYRLPFEAIKGNAQRFSKNQKAASNISGTYAVKLGKTDAIGLFNQHENYLTGTFLTSTGDYRYLEGKIADNKLFLSSFDGMHILLFEADIDGDKLVNGKMWSGKSANKEWNGVADKEAKLPDANKLTFLKKGYDKFAFSFKNQKGETISLTDKRYKGKVVVVQIMGSWCPNCLDESKFFSPLYDRKKEEGLEVIGLSFERSSDPEKAYKRINSLKKRLDINYEVVYAGTTKQAASALPMLNHIMSFPTSIIVDRKGEVQLIHTGFNGPSTGHYYEDYVSETTSLINNLLKEPN